MDKILEEFKNMEKFVEMIKKQEDTRKMIVEKEKNIETLNEKKSMSIAPLEREYFENEYNKEKEVLSQLKEEKKLNYEKISASFKKQKEKMIAEIDNEIKKYVETEKNKKAEKLKKTEDEKNVYSKIALRSKNEMDKIISKINDGTNTLDDLQRLGYAQNEYKSNTQKVANLELELEAIKNAVIKPSERYVDLNYLKSRIRATNLDNIETIKEDQFLKKYGEMGKDKDKTKDENETKGKENEEKAKKEEEQKAINEKTTKGKEEKNIFNFDKNPLNAKKTKSEEPVKSEEKPKNEEKNIFNFDKNPLNAKKTKNEEPVKSEEEKPKNEEPVKSEEKETKNEEPVKSEEEKTKNEELVKSEEEKNKNEKPKNEKTKTNKIVKIEINEGKDVINLIAENGKTYKVKNALEKTLNDKKRIFKEPDIERTMETLEPSKIKRFFFKRKLNPIILEALNNNNQFVTMAEYMVAVRDSKKCETLDVKHVLNGSVLKGKQKRMMRRIAKRENEIEGMEVIGLKENKISGLLESGKKKIKNRPTTIKERIKLVGKLPAKAMRLTKSAFTKTVRMPKKIRDRADEIAKKFDSESLDDIDKEKTNEKADDDIIDI